MCETQERMQPRELPAPGCLRWTWEKAWRVVSPIPPITVVVVDRYVLYPIELAVRLRGKSTPVGHVVRAIQTPRDCSRAVRP